MCGRCKRDVSRLIHVHVGERAGGDERGRQGTDGLVNHDILRAYAGSGSQSVYLALRQCNL
jgi:hypothetical protein